MSEFELWHKNSVAQAKNLSIPRSISLCLLLLYFVTTPVLAVDPNRHISQYAHTAWRLQDGIFNAAPQAITQTTDGYLWIGTQAGLVHFDGIRFVPWSSPDGMQLDSSVITFLHGARDGSLWIGTKTGLSHWENQRLINYPSLRGRINFILEDRDGTVWITRTRFIDGAGPLCHIIGMNTHCYGKADGIPDLGTTFSLVEDSERNIWIGKDTSLVRWKPGSSTVYSPSGLKSNANMGGVTALAAGPDNSLWVGMALPGPDMGLQQMVRGVWEPFVTPELDGRSLEVETLFLDRQNALWIGTFKQGIYRIFGREVDHFQAKDGLSGDTIYEFCEDREGNVWVVTSKGIDNFRDIRVATYSTREGLSTDEVDSVLAAHDGTIWIGEADALDALRQDKLFSIRTGKGLPGNQVTSLLEDHNGQLWVGIDNTIAIFRNGKFRRIDKPDGSPVGLVMGIAEDVDNNIWIETQGPPLTLIRIKGLKVREEFPAPQMPAAQNVAADPSGGIWLGTMTGDLARYVHDQKEVITFKHSPDANVKQLIVNSDGSVLGATASGLIGWKQGKQKTLTVRNGLPCASIHALIFDKAGALWLNTQCGLVEIASTELQKWWELPEAPLKMRVFDEFDGAQPAFAPFQRAARTLDGRLWFANGIALQMIDPTHLAGNVLPPPVYVERVIADRKSYAPRGNLHLPPLTRDLEIDYTALSFVAPQKVRFRYMLEGHDSDWQDPGTRRQAFYNDLSPGRYRFHVIACNNDGLWNDVGASLQFSVASAWFQTIWFRFLCGALAVLLLWCLYRLRVRQIAAGISIRFDERLAERTRLARDLHDTLLQTVQGSKMVVDDALDIGADERRMRNALEKLSVWLGRAVDEGRAALHYLRVPTTKKNYLSEFLQRAIEDHQIPSSMTVAFSVIGKSKDVHPIVRDEVYQVGYEAIRNATAHSGASRLEIDLQYANNLLFRIKDNGVGIDPSFADKGRAGHFGLQGMRERASRIRGKLTITSSVNAGTEVALIVPGNVAYRNAHLSVVNRFKETVRRLFGLSSVDGG